MSTRGQQPGDSKGAANTLAVRPINSRTIVLLATVVALGLRLRGITWGLPYLYDPDEPDFVERAVHILGHADPNPHWFGHPGSTVIYLLALVYAVYFVAGYVVGTFPDTASYALLFKTDPSSFYLVGRTVLMGISVTAVPLTYALARGLMGETAAAIAALLVAVSPLHARYSQLIRTDGALTSCVLLVLVLAVRGRNSRSMHPYLQAGAAVGAATATKWPGILAGLSVMASLMLPRANGPTRARQLCGMPRALAGVALSTLGAFVLCSPFALIDMGNVLKNVRTEAARAGVGELASGGVAGPVWWLQGPLRDALGLPLELLAGTALVGWLVRRRAAELVVLAFAVPFFALISFASSPYERWAVPLVPVVAILAASALDLLSGTMASARVEGRSTQHPGVRSQFAALAVAAILVAPSTMRTFAQGIVDDTRTVAKEWFEANVAPQSRVAVEQYGAPISRTRYEVLRATSSGLKHDESLWGWKGGLVDLGGIEELRAAGIEYVITAFWCDSCLTADATGRPSCRVYVDLSNEASLIYRVDPSAARRGPTIRVWRLPTGDRADSLSRNPRRGFLRSWEGQSPHLQVTASAGGASALRETVGSW